jgi:hypothetical protein
MPRRSIHRSPARFVGRAKAKCPAWNEANKAGLKGWSLDRFDLSGMLRFQVTT